MKLPIKAVQYASGLIELNDADGLLLAECYNNSAADIIRAVNNAERLVEAMEFALQKPHPTWCKARQGGGCTCYKAILRDALAEYRGTE